MNIANRTTAVILSADAAANLIDPRRPVTAFARDAAEGFVIGRHYHHRAQLVYASAGVMLVTTAAATWVVAPQQAVWVPPGVEHEISARGRLALRSVYIDPGRIQGMPEACCVVTVRPLLRELILTILALDGQPGNARLERLHAVLLDELVELQAVAFHLPAPLDRRLKAIAQALLDDPSDGRNLAQWSTEVGASERTLSRLFARDTGLAFGEWRTRLKMLSAIEQLSLGRSVSDTAYRLGYQSPSAFVARFRKTLGTSPGRYLREQR